MKEPSPVEQVEAHLHIQHLYNVEHEIWPSHNIIIERLLAHSENMAHVYDELFRVCPRGYPFNSNWEHWQYVINNIVETAAGWSLKEMESVRDAVKEIKGADGTKGLNQSIKNKASELADLLRKRNKICELNSLARPNDYHPVDLIESATKIASKNRGDGAGAYGRYTSSVKKYLDALRGQFDLKYWPSTADMLDALAEMQDVEPTPRNTLTAAALRSRQSSIRDFLRALEADALAPDCSVSFSDESLAAITNCVLGLDGEIEPSSVKKYRADERKLNK